MVGYFGGRAAAFSFHKTKSMSTFEGGMILVTTTYIDLMVKRLELSVNQGQVGKYNHEYLGFNFRLAEPLMFTSIPQY